MEVTIIPKGEFTITLPVNDIIKDINKMSLNERFTVIAMILNKVQLSDKQDLTESQRMVVKDFLERTYESITGKMLSNNG